ncbi:hypothetical protein [Conexibacter woesei]|uniref:Uncharacterized protein n=1 Tax=Conexibacter woesei (strain DSM 14684 / CCUG 47730 / CIP 108061 / JCM 11494 / NBRC 100937 / ID131577) TaxID=469383 RepID=D3FAD3_CONWI|nr:hypothetical protein [Conexibacter woesei]ADB49202.1 hypothetical protein Cwoe_0769 [Conexibacter woesei DSM 14684]
MGQRSRKRGQRSGAVAPPAAASQTDASAAPAAPGTEPAAEPARPSRTELRNAEARAALVPLADGERPGAVTAGALVSTVLGVLVVVGYASGARVGGEGSLAGALFLAGIFLVAGYGMWRVRYWAVLGFEALLAFQIVVASLSLMVASNVWAALLCVAVIVLGGWLFWKLIRAMARIQMPERRPAR